MSMSNQKHTFHIDGMTCASCENRIERAVSSIPGVVTVNANYKDATATVVYQSEVTSLEPIRQAIEAQDYKVIPKPENRKKRKESAGKAAGVIIALIGLYFLFNQLGLLSVLNSFPVAEAGMGYGMLFVIGLLTSVHCVAMCGGINLSQCMPSFTSGYTSDSKSGSAAGSMKSSLLPSLLYNAGRVASYTIIGAIVGAIGSVVSFSGPMKGIVQLAAGVFMVIMGLNMLNLFPWLRRFHLRMPSFFARRINAQKVGAGPLYVGLLNGLMPCGPLQSMQLYALSTGDPMKGALSMLLFSLGTVPLMFGLGAAGSLLSKKFTMKAMKVSAALVVVLGVLMFSNGAVLSGIAFPSLQSVIGTSGNSAVSYANGNIAVMGDGIQTVTTTLASGRYAPITVQKGVPVRWIIQAEDRNINGCNNRLQIPEYQKELQLQPGDNIIEFTPDKSGVFPYSCWMGMIRSKITVVDDLSAAEAGSGETDGSDSIGGAVTKGMIPTDQLAIAEIKDGIQYVRISMKQKSFSPAVLVLQSGVKTVWTIESDSDATILFPLYYAQLTVQSGENVIELIPDRDFDFSLSDQSVYGYVKVVEDLDKINPDSVRNEIENYDPSASDYYSEGGFGGGTGASCH